MLYITGYDYTRFFFIWLVRYAKINEKVCVFSVHTYFMVLIRVIRKML